MDASRRRLLLAGLAWPVSRAWPAAPTPACGKDEPTPSQMAGPFYTPNSPLKRDFRADDPRGAAVDLHAVVLDRQCKPIAGAVVDLWHADSKGRYDNDGFRLRGHQVADASGAVKFETVMPANYGGRTRHYHARIFRPGGGKLLTTQLYFPGERDNAGDGLFEKELLLATSTHGDRTEARFAFVVAA